MRSIASLVFSMLLLLQELLAQHSQYATLKGTVMDSLTRQPIEAATVSIFLATDSTLLNYAITNRKGEFQIKDIPVSIPCRILVSCSGLGTFTKDLTIAPGTKELTFPLIQLKKTYTELEEVIVSARRQPVLFKNDTIEFDAGSFKTPPNGLLEDLLKILPGLEVDEQGNITVNGKRVSKITVDGKDFFGSDFKIATKNLPRDIIDKIQIMEFKSFEARFNKTSMSNKEMAINLTLKTTAKKGWFGRIGSGYGTNYRHEAGGSLNYLKGPLHLNAIGSLNNINRGGTTGTDFALGKLDGRMETSGQGILITKAGGLNIGHEFSSKLQVNSSYFHNHGLTTQATTLRRQNILPDRVFFYNSINDRTDVNNDHRLNLDVKYQPDSATIFVAKMVYNGSNGTRITANDATTTHENNELMNGASNRFASLPKLNNLYGELFIGRRLKKSGRAFIMSMKYNDVANSAQESNKGSTIFYQSGGSSVEEKVDQQSSMSEDSKELNLSASFTEPISKAIDISIGYNFTQTNGQTGKTTHRFNPLSGLYDLIDTFYTNSLKNRLYTHAPNWTIAWSSPQLRTNLGFSVQWMGQINEAALPKKVLQQSFINLFPTVQINYRFSKTSSLNLNYTGRSHPPTLEQLQPMADNRNTLYIRLGNPSLKPAFQHTMDMEVQRQINKGFYVAGLALNLLQNEVVEDTWFDSVQVTRWVNSNGNYSLSSHTGFNYIWRKKNWSLRLSAFNHGTYARRRSFVNKVALVSNTYNFSQRLGLTYTYKNLITLMPSFSLLYLINRFAGQVVQPSEFVTKTFRAMGQFHWPRRFVLENNFQYITNSQSTPGLAKAVILWNVAVNYQINKDRQTILRLAAFDVLQQNTNVNRILRPTYIEDNESMVLQRYFLLSFIYNLKQMK